MEKTKEETVYRTPLLIERYMNKKFGRLLIVDVWSEKKWNNQCTYAKCVCDCGKIVEFVSVGKIVSGHTQSCGCLKSEVALEKKKINEYYYENGYVVIIPNNSEELIMVDEDDFENIKDFCWTVSENYAVTMINKKRFLLHHFIMEKSKNRNICIDHINRNGLDNRKNNLRYATFSQNIHNQNKKTTNTSGFIGVGKTSNGKMWFAYLIMDGVRKYLGQSEKKKDAIILRLNAEKLFLGEFAPQRHLFEEYGIQ